ncbi:MAG TPA: hypothetical protein DCS13_02265 [Candidatus Margulisbacteria bacterium]|nr:hypothetical protein [Candidatus Margulisiibacteriota bacterium]
MSISEVNGGGAGAANQGISSKEEAKLLNTLSSGNHAEAGLLGDSVLGNLASAGVNILDLGMAEVNINPLMSVDQWGK